MHYTYYSGLWSTHKAVTSKKGSQMCTHQYPPYSWSMVCCNLQGAVTFGRISKEATLQLSVEMSTALTSETTASELYRDTADASSGAVELAGRASRAAMEQYQSALRLQNLTGQVWTLGLSVFAVHTLSYLDLLTLVTLCAAPCLYLSAQVSTRFSQFGLHPSCALSAAFWHDKNRYNAQGWR